MKFSEIYDNAPADLAKIEITGIYCDSRLVKPGCVFVCIDGTFKDGHEFANSAVEDGASIIICQRDLQLKNQLIVEDTRKVYSAICAAYFGNPATKLKIIGITGTSGKSSIASMTKSLLEQAGHKVGLIGTIQNAIGDKVLTANATTPDPYELHSLLLLMVKAGCEFVVMEVSSHALDQQRVYGLKFEIAVFTNLTQDHLDYHLNMENYFKAKCKLFKMCKKAIINIDDEYGKRLVEQCECEVLTYSLNDDAASFTAKEINYKVNGINYELVSTGLIGRVKLKHIGIFSVYNSMATGIVGILIGIDFYNVISSLSNVEAIKGRAEVVKCDQDFTLIIDYAHTPNELENILSTLLSIKKGRLVTLFGCGGDRDKTKRPQMGKIASLLSDYVIITSDNPRSENVLDIINDILEGMKEYDTPYIIIENRAKAIHYAIDNALPDDIILFAGKGHETYQVLSSGTIHFDEREIIMQVLNKK